MLDKATILTDKLQDIEYIKYTKVIEPMEALEEPMELCLSCS